MFLTDALFYCSIYIILLHAAVRTSARNLCNRSSAGLTMAQVAHLRKGLCPRGPHNFTLIIFVHMKYTKNEDSSHTLSFLFESHLILCSSKELHTK